jgi:hypothetical protein
MVKPRAAAVAGSKIVAMKRPILFALLLAIPVEVVNFFFLAFPIDVGLPEDASWLEKLAGSQWVILHLPGLRLLDWFDRMGLSRLGIFAVFASGYLDTVLVLIVGIFAFRWFRRLTGGL